MIKTLDQSIAVDFSQLRFDNPQRTVRTSQRVYRLSRTLHIGLTGLANFIDWVEDMDEDKRLKNLTAVIRVLSNHNCVRCAEEFIPTRWLGLSRIAAPANRLCADGAGGHSQNGV